MKNIHKIEKQLYITNDKEIKEGDLVMSNYGELIKISYKGSKVKENVNEYCKKIILTTDQDLIKDGVQAIDDEFLEWFVKNPSCEEVKVNKSYGGTYYIEYPFVISKEDLTKCYCGHTTTCDCGTEEPKQETLEEYTEDYKPSFVDLADTLPKQETLEEVSERYANESFVPMRNSDGEILRIPSGQTVPCGFTKHKKVAIKHFTNGYKLAQERIYNEIKELYDNENITGFSKLAYAKCLDIIKNK